MVVTISEGGTVGGWDDVRGNAMLLLVLLLPVVSSMLDGLDVSRQEAGAGAHRSRLVNRRDLEVDG
jgi:hypothetical protein